MAEDQEGRRRGDPRGNGPVRAAALLAFNCLHHNIPITDVAEWMGHKSIDITYKDLPPPHARLHQHRRQGFGHGADLLRAVPSCERRCQMVDDAASGRLRYPEQRHQLPQSQVRPPIRGDQQNPVLQRQAPRSPPADRIRAFASQCGQQLAELPRAQPGERGCPGRLRRRDHTSHTEIIPCGGAALRDVRRNRMVWHASGVENHRMHEVKLSDGIITLSPLRLDDVEAHLTGEDELLVRWLNGGPGTREGIEVYFRHCQEQWETAGPLRAFGIRVGADEVLAGTVDLRFAGEGLTPGQVNVAYGLYPSWRGRGLATRAVLLASQYAANEGGEEAVIQVEPENPASAAVAQRAGFTLGKQTHSKDGTQFNWYIRELHVTTQ